MKNKIKHVIKIPIKAVDIYRLLPDGTRCEVIFNEMVFSDRRNNGYKNIPYVPASALEVYRILPKGTPCEVIFNTLIMQSPKTSQHQLMLSELNALLYFF